MIKRLTNRIITSLSFIFIFSAIANATVEQNQQSKTNNLNSDPKYIQEEVLVRLKQGADPSVVFSSLNFIESFKRVHSIKRVIAISKAGGNGRSSSNLNNKSDEEIFNMAYQEMPPVQQKLFRSYIVKLIKGTSEKEAIVKLQELKEVEVASYNHIFEVQMEPNDPFYTSQGSWGQNYGDLWGIKKLQSNNAWDISQGEGAVVAVVDTGVDYNHEDLHNNMWTNSGEVPNNGIDDDNNGYIDDVYGYNFASSNGNPMDGYGHGTHVSGTIAAIGNNNLGVIGVAPKAKIMAVKGLSDQGSGSSADLAEAIVYAVDNGAKVINNSWSSNGRAPSDPIIEDAVGYGYSHGTVMVFSAGNRQDDVAYYSPQNSPKVIVVGASSEDDGHCYFSNYGTNLTVSAPGCSNVAGDNVVYNILSSLSDNTFFGTHHPELKVANNYYREAGTSMSAPHVSGLAALLISRYPNLKTEPVKLILGETADDLGASGFDISFGYGRINSFRALSSSGIYINEELIDDHTTGNDNGNVDRGEIIQLKIPLIAIGSDMQQVEATLSTTDSDVTILGNPNYFYGSIASGEVSNMSSPFNIQFSNNVTSRLIPFTFNITARTAQGILYQITRVFSIEVRIPQNFNLVSGDFQSGNPGNTLSPLVVELVDQFGRAIINQRVNFSLLEGNAQLSSNQVYTDTFGRAYINVTLGKIIGSNQYVKNVIKASADGFNNFSVNFTEYTTNFHISFQKTWDLLSQYPNFFKGNAYDIRRIYIADLDHDGRKEIYLSVTGSVDRLYILEENVTNSYVLRSTIDLGNNGGYVTSFDLGDINRDGNEEMVLGTKYGHVLTIRSTQNNQFVMNDILDLFVFNGFQAIESVKISDVNKDMRPDIVVWGYNTGGIGKGYYLKIYTHTGVVGDNNYSQIYSNYETYPTGHGFIHSTIVVGDIDNDHNPDMIIRGDSNPSRLNYFEYEGGSFIKKQKVVSNIDINIRPKSFLIADFKNINSNQFFTYGSNAAGNSYALNMAAVGNDTFINDWTLELGKDYFLNALGTESQDSIKGTTLGLVKPIAFVGQSGIQSTRITAYINLGNDFVLIGNVPNPPTDTFLADFMIENSSNANSKNILTATGTNDIATNIQLIKVINRTPVSAGDFTKVDCLPGGC